MLLIDLCHIKIIPNISLIALESSQTLQLKSTATLTRKQWFFDCKNDNFERGFLLAEQYLSD